MMMAMESGVLSWTSVVLAAFVAMATGSSSAGAEDNVREEALEQCLRDPLPPYEIEWMLKPVSSPLVITWNITVYGQLSDDSTCNSSLSCYPFDPDINDSSEYAMPTQLRPKQIQRGQGIRLSSWFVFGNGTVVRLHLVDETGFLDCDETRGRLLSLSPDGGSRRMKTVDSAVSPGQLKMGVNYLIAVDVGRSNRSGSFLCESGLRISVTVLESSDCNRLSNETCFNRGRCVANFTSSSFYCRCCPGWACLRRNQDEPVANQTIGIWKNYEIRNNGRRIKTSSYKTKSKPAAESSPVSAVSVANLDQVPLHHSMCNRTATTCRTQNNSACVVEDKELNGLKCSCANQQIAGADCATEAAAAHGETDKVDDDEEEGDDDEVVVVEEKLDICDPNPCLNGICIVDGKQRDSFRCYCVPGFGGKFCDQHYNSPCSPNPCKNDGVCRPTNEAFEGGAEEAEGGGDEATGTRSETGDGEDGDNPRLFECLCRPGYVKEDCSSKASVCQSNPCLHVCFDHGDYYVCECNPGFTGENCDALINTCESNPCQNGGICESTPYGYSCQCPFGYHGNHCEHHAFPDFLVPPHHPPQLHSLQMVGFTLTGAVAIAMVVIVCCYCNLGRFCDALVCPTATSSLMTKYEKQLECRRGSHSHVDRKRRRNQSLDGDSATTNAFMDDDVETTSLHDRLFIEEDEVDDPSSNPEDARGSGRDRFGAALGSHKVGRSMSRLHLLDV